MESSTKCDCIIYLAGYDYENYVPIHLSEHGGSWKQGDEQYYFNFCPLCGKKIDRPTECVV